MEIRIVTDSGADLPADLAKELGIEVVPLRILFGDKDYRDGIDIDIGELYERLEKGPVHPTTSTPSPGEFANAYSRLIKEGGKRHCLHSFIIKIKQDLRQRPAGSRAFNRRREEGL